LNQERFAKSATVASVVAAAPTDGAPLLALHKLDKRFGATHALKVVIGKGLNYGVKLFIFDEPTVALDVGAKAEIHRLLAFPIREGRGRYHGLVLPAAGTISPTPCTSFGRADSSEATDTRSLPKK
jgi:hypothetical protein